MIKKDFFPILVLERERIEREKAEQERAKKGMPLGMDTRLDLDIEQIKQFRKEGKSYREIGRLMGCSDATIRNRLKEG